MRKLRIPKRSDHPIVKDNLTHFYHIPVLRSFFIKRLTMTLDLFENKKFNNILEVGFGSGVLLHELTQIASDVHACDIHEHIDEVKKLTEQEGLKVHLKHGNILTLPYEDNQFDAIISVAVIEHIHGLEKAISELKRVLKPGGMLALGFPYESKITDFLLTAAGSTKAYRQKLREIHPNSHADIIQETGKQFLEVKAQRFPPYFPEWGTLYCSLSAVK